MCLFLSYHVIADILDDSIIKLRDATKPCHCNIRCRNSNGYQVTVVVLKKIFNQYKLVSIYTFAY